MLLLPGLLDGVDEEVMAESIPRDDLDEEASDAVLALKGDSSDPRILRFVFSLAMASPSPVTAALLLIASFYRE